MKPTNTDTQQVQRDIEAQMSDEQAADLATLQANIGPGAGQPVHMVEAEPAGPDLATELQGLLTVAVQTLKPAFPSLGTIYTPETIGAAAGAIAGVCNKHGWMQGGLLGEWGEEIACVAVVGPLAIATYQGVKGDIEARKAKDKTIENAGATLPAVDLTAHRPADPTPNGKTVQIGGVQHV